MATHWDHSAWSDACSDGGDGQCDGIIPDDEELPHGIPDECACPCHGAWDSWPFTYPTTVEEMHEAHIAYHKEFPSESGEE